MDVGGRSKLFGFRIEVPSLCGRRSSGFEGIVELDLRCVVVTSLSFMLVRHLEYAL